MIALRALGYIALFIGFAVMFFCAPTILCAASSQCWAQYTGHR